MSMVQNAPGDGWVPLCLVVGGLIVGFSERVAVRPEVGFSFASSSTSNATSDSSVAAPGFSALFYLKKIESLRTYFSPRYTCSRSHTTTTLTVPPNTTQQSTSTTHNVSGSFGAEYAIHQHFGVFGEVGLAYGHTSTTSTFGNRAGLGAILYF